jgi:acyl carrier protein
MYTQEQIQKTIKQIIYSLFPDRSFVNIEYETNMVTELQLDSLDIVEIVCDFEKRFGLVVSDLDTDKLLENTWSFGVFCDILQKYTKNLKYTEIPTQKTAAPVKPKNTFVFKMKEIFTRKR